MRTSSLLTSLLLLLLLGACTDDDSHDEEDNNTNNLQERWGELRLQLKESLCREFTQCPSTETPYIESLSQCRNALGALTQPLLLNELQHTLDANPEALNQEAYDTCVAQLATLQCQQTLESIPACRQLLSGWREEGEYCTSHYECLSGYCNSLQTCPNSGVCTATQPQGGPCTEHRECDLGLVCNHFTKLCSPKAYQGLSELCDGPGQCEYGTSCVVPQGATAGSCRNRLTPGAPCDHDNPTLAKCQPGTGCDPMLRQCRTITPVGEGETCSSTLVCNAGNREYCDPIHHVCAHLPIAGEPCKALGLDAVCWTGHYCGADNYCHAKKALGAPCGAHEECSSEKCGLRGLCEYDPCSSPTSLL